MASGGEERERFRPLIGAFPSRNSIILLLVVLAPLAVRSQQPPILPDPKLTPGATLPVTKDDICVPGYTKKARNVPKSVKDQVYAEYGIISHQPKEFEVDHLISLELGGSNSIKNLWPESYKTQPWNAHVKDQLKNRLHWMVCSGQLDLATAQHDIATDWISAYKKYLHTNQPLSMSHGRSADRAASAPVTGGTGQVWVNTASGKYFRPGSRYHGHTKQGRYMSEADAIKAGYTAAKR
jgi:hypothetical protein